MKKKYITMPLVAAAIGGLTWASVVAVSNHSLEQTPPQPTITVDQSNERIQAVKIQEEGEYNALITRFNAQALECQKGANAYAKLSQAVRNVTPKPTCTTKIQ